MPEDLKHFSGRLIGAARDLKQELTVDEQSFLSIAAQGHADARDYYPFTVLNEIQKAAFGTLGTASPIIDRSDEGEPPEGGPPEGEPEADDGLGRRAARRPPTKARSGSAS